jgi:hypothetical protein
VSYDTLLLAHPELISDIDKELKMKKFKYLAWIMVVALVLSACTISASKKPKATSTAGVNPTAAGSTISNLAAATATAQKVVATEQIASKKTQKTTNEPAQSTKPPQPAATDTPVPPVATSAPARLTFESGGNLASARGEMNAGAVNSYVLKAEAGQVLSVDVWSPNGDVYLSITSSDGKELLGTTSKATRWTGAVPTSQEYTFTVTATGGLTSFSIDIVITAAGVTPTPLATVVPGTPGTPKPTSGSVATGPFDPYAIYGSPTMKDPMNGGNITDWMSVNGKLPNTGSLKITLDNAKTYVTGKRSGWATWWFSPTTLDNVYMQMTAETDACSGKDSYGMILRGPEHGAGISFGYIFAFSCDGAYQVTRLDSASPYSAVTLVGWTKSKYILDGSYQRNVLGIKMDGKILTLYANGYQLAEISDSVYRSGRYGLYVYPDTSNDFMYRVVEMAYWSLGIKK